MAKGSVAKIAITEKIKECFGTNYIGVQDNKIYVWENDGGERVQIAISMTCPKVGIGEGSSVPAPFLDMTTVPETKEPARISEEERDNIQKMMIRLGLF